MKALLKSLTNRIKEKQNELKYCRYVLNEYREELNFHNQHMDLNGCCDRNKKEYCNIHTNLNVNIEEWFNEWKKVKKEIKKLKERKKKYVK